MGTSTDGHLSYGVLFDEGFEFPWDDEEFEDDIEEWWKKVRGYVNPIECPFDDEGRYRPGFDDKSPIVDQYFEHQREWLEENPVPVDVVNYCSSECGMFILATRDISCSRGYPEKIDVALLQDVEEDRKRLMAFLEEFGIVSDVDDCGPRWWLSSYWG